MKNVIFPEKINASNCAAIYGVLTGGRYGRESTVGVWEYYGGTTYTIIIYNPYQYQLKRFIFKRYNKRYIIYQHKKESVLKRLKLNNKRVKTDNIKVIKKSLKESESF